MDRGPDFLKAQVNNSVMQHETFLRNLEDHEGQAEDPRYRDLCSRFIPHVREHQRMLEQYQQAIGAEAGAGKKMLGAALGLGRDLVDAARESDFLRLVGDIVTSRQSQDTFYTFAEAGKKLLGAALGLGRDLADAARESDFLRLVGDIVTSRQSQDTFYTFAEAGKALGDATMQQIGETGQRHHEEYAREANKLAVQFFVEHARGTDPTMTPGQVRDTMNQRSSI